MAWIGVTTNAGVNLMASWTSGTVLNIESAVSGSGTVPEVALLAQTALVTPKQTVSIVSSKIENGARKIKIQIQAPQAEYTLNQIGLFASLNGGSPVLLALFQNDDGILIPSVSDSPDFLYTFYCFLTVSSGGEFTLTVDTSALVSYGEMKDQIREHNEDTEAHEDLRRAVRELAAKTFFVISDTEPENGPVLWFDTGYKNRQDDNVVLLRLGGEEDEALAQVIAEIAGQGYPVLNAEISKAQEENTYHIEIE